MARKSTTIVFALFGLTAMTTVAAAQPQGLPAPTPQHEMLDMLVGDWTITGQTYKGSPYGEGKFTAKEHNEWMPSRLVVISRTQYSALFKNSNQVAFYTVDSDSGRYSYYMQSSLGVTVQSLGDTSNKSAKSLVSNPITWTDKRVNTKALGSQDEISYQTEVISPNEYRFKLMRNGVLTYDGVAKKVSSAKKK